METSMSTNIITKDRVIRLFTVLFGSLLYAISVNMFITPHKLIAGGVAGVALILQYVTKISSGYFVFIINIPLFIIGIRELDKEFGIYSLIGMISMSIFLVITKDITNVYVMKDVFLSSLCGGALCGIGMGIIFRSKASEGGTDIISIIVRKRYGLKISTITFIINLIIVAAGGFLGTVEIAIYTIISMYIKSMVLDKVIEGLDKKKLLFVITKDPEGVKNIILTKLGRGVTFLHGEGAYTGEDKKIVYSVMSSKQLARCRILINTIDPKAVITIMDVSEVEGKGFKKASF